MTANEFINLTAYRGDDLSIDLIFKDYATQDPYDITHWTISFTVKEKTYQSDVDAAIVIDVTTHTFPLEGKTRIFIPHAMTDGLVGIYQYDIQFKTGDDMIRTFARGQIEFNDDVSRR